MEKRIQLILFLLCLTFGQVMAYGSYNNEINCRSNIYDCEDLGDLAQDVYDYCKDKIGYDVHKLDADYDGLACESRNGGYSSYNTNYTCPFNAVSIGGGLCSCLPGYEVGILGDTCVLSYKNYTYYSNSAAGNKNTCPSNSSNYGNECMCNIGYCPLSGKCYKSPSNSSCVLGDSSDAWKCNNGYNESNGICIKDNASNKAPSLPSPSAPKNMDYFESDKNRHCDINYKGTIYDSETGYCACENKKGWDGTCFTPNNLDKKLTEKIDKIMKTLSEKKRDEVKSKITKLLTKYNSNEQYTYIFNYIINWQPSFSEILGNLFPDVSSNNKESVTNNTKIPSIGEENKNKDLCNEYDIGDIFHDENEDKKECQQVKFTRCNDGKYYGPHVDRDKNERKNGALEINFNKFKNEGVCMNKTLADVEEEVIAKYQPTFTISFNDSAVYGNANNTNELIIGETYTLFSMDIKLSENVGANGGEISLPELEENRYVFINGEKVKHYFDGLIPLKSGETKTLSIIYTPEEDDQYINDIFEYEFKVKYINSSLPGFMKEEINNSLYDWSLVNRLVAGNNSGLIEIVNNGNGDDKWIRGYSYKIKNPN